MQGNINENAVYIEQIGGVIKLYIFVVVFLFKLLRSSAE